jgi:hypothetical protein
MKAASVGGPFHFKRAMVEHIMSLMAPLRRAGGL